MHLPGHLSIGYLIVAGPALADRRPIDLRHALIPAVIGSITPDLIDKSLRAIELTAYSRSLGHSIFFLLFLVALWKWADLRHLTHARSFGWWVAGITSHFAVDLFNDLFRGLEARGYAFSAWFGWPITTHETSRIQLELGTQLHPTYTSLELGIFALTLAVILASRRHTTNSLHDDF